MDIHVYLHGDPELKLWLESKFHILNQRTNTMAQALDDLTQAVADEHTVIQSAITLISGFADKLAAAGTDPVKLAKLHADITADTQALAAAVAAGTPVAPVVVDPIA